MPGIIVTQHSGDGKASQYFLRIQFHRGSDVATHVAGISVNHDAHATASVPGPEYNKQHGLPPAAIVAAEIDPLLTKGKACVNNRRKNVVRVDCRSANATNSRQLLASAGLADVLSYHKDSVRARAGDCRFSLH